MEWVSGSFGSHTSYLYPMTILKGKGSRMEFTGITFAGHGQNLDTGAKVVHTGADTSSYINTKSISKDGGISTFRSAVVINKDAKNSKAAVSCQSLMLDSESRALTGLGDTPINLVRSERLELSWLSPQRPQRCASTNSATTARQW